LDVRFQLGKCVRLVMINLLIHCSQQVKVAGGQVRRLCRPQAFVHHMLFTEIPMQVSQCCLGCVRRSIVLLEKAIKMLVPCQMGIKFVQYLQVFISVDCIAL
jgi:hypothetical protein